MGKKTDQFAEQLSTLTEACEEGVAKVAASGDTLPTIKQALERCLEVMTARREHFSPGGKVTEEGDEATAKDGSYINATVAIATVVKKVQLVGHAQTKLRADLQALQKKTEEFEKYVKTKEKKWFVGKKSVPAAKEAITAAQDFFKACRALG